MRSSKLEALYAYRHGEPELSANITTKDDNRVFLLDAHLSDLSAENGAIPKIKGMQLPANDVMDSEFLKFSSLADQSASTKWD